MRCLLNSVFIPFFLVLSYYSAELEAQAHPVGDRQEVAYLHPTSDPIQATGHTDNSFPSYVIALLIITIIVCAGCSAAILAIFYFINRHAWKEGVSLRVRNLVPGSSTSTSSTHRVVPRHLLESGCREKKRSDVAIDIFPDSQPQATRSRSFRNLSPTFSPSSNLQDYYGDRNSVTTTGSSKSSARQLPTDPKFKTQVRFDAPREVQPSISGRGSTQRTIPLRRSSHQQSTTFPNSIRRVKEFFCCLRGTSTSREVHCGRQTPPISLPIPIMSTSSVLPSDLKSLPTRTSTSHSPDLALSPISGFYSLHEFEAPLSAEDILSSFLDLAVSQESFASSCESLVEEEEMVNFPEEVLGERYPHGEQLDTIFEESDEDSTPQQNGSGSSQFPISDSKSSVILSDAEAYRASHSLFYTDSKLANSLSIPDIPNESCFMSLPFSGTYCDDPTGHSNGAPGLPENIPTPTLSIVSALRSPELMNIDDKINGCDTVIDCAKSWGTGVTTNETAYYSAFSNIPRPEGAPYLRSTSDIADESRGMDSASILGAVGMNLSITSRATSPDRRAQSPLLELKVISPPVSQHSLSSLKSGKSQHLFGTEEKENHPLVTPQASLSVRSGTSRRDSLIPVPEATKYSPSHRQIKHPLEFSSVSPSSSRTFVRDLISFSNNRKFYHLPSPPNGPDTSFEDEFSRYTNYFESSWGRQVGD